MLSPEISSVTALVPIFWSHQLPEEKESSCYFRDNGLRSATAALDLGPKKKPKNVLPPILSSNLRLLTPSTTLPPPEAREQVLGPQEAAVPGN